MASANPESPRRVDDRDGAHQVVEVGERFAHAHENDIVDLVAAGAFHRDDLIDNFVRAQISRKSVQAARAEFAAVSAANLRRDTNGPSIGARAVERGRSGNEDRFNQAFIRQTEQKFLGGIVRAQFSDDVDPVEGKVLRESRPQALREVRHFIEGGRALLVKPISDLRSAIGRLAQFVQRFCNSSRCRDLMSILTAVTNAHHDRSDVGRGFREVEAGSTRSEVAEHLIIYVFTRSAAAHQAPTGFIRKYIFSLDHKVIGIQYYFLALFSVFLGMFLSLLMRYHMVFPDAKVALFEKLWPTGAAGGIMTPELYLSLMTMHGTIMVFFVLTTAPQSGFGNYFLPIQIGAEDMAFPVLNMLSFWTTFLALVVMVSAFFVEAARRWAAGRRILR